MIKSLKSIFSFRYDDRPMTDLVYEAHRSWIKYFHDYFFRCEHHGSVKKSLDSARREHVVFISNHALTFEAVLMNYYLHLQRAGIVNTLVYPEAFKLPLIREFFRSTQCIPISVEKGAQALHRHHVLLFPEGMDFLRGLADPDRAPRFHTGFLRIAKSFLQSNGRKTLRVVPVAHAGVESSFKFWTVKNKTFLDLFIRPWANYPFWVIPKLPFLIPSKVIFNWGEPIRINRSDLRGTKQLEGLAERFRLIIHDLRKEAILIRDQARWGVGREP